MHQELGTCAQYETSGVSLRKSRARSSSRETELLKQPSTFDMVSTLWLGGGSCIAVLQSCCKPDRIGTL